MQLEMPDKKANLESPTGEKYLQKDGVVEVPTHVGQQFLAAGIPGVKQYRKYYGGVDLNELRARAEAMREAKQFAQV